MNKKRVITLLLAAGLMQGCAMLSVGGHRLGSLSRIEVQMDKADVEKVLGTPNVVRVGKKLSDDKTYELHEYKLYDDAAVNTLSWFLIIPPWPFLGTQTFWLHYVNSKLVFWGDAGDWRGAPKWFSNFYVDHKPGQEQMKAMSDPE